jgi:CRISPR/Cas system Type II protein with McrA/HNH and RuvC-like nuclease domain
MVTPEAKELLDAYIKFSDEAYRINTQRYSYSMRISALQKEIYAHDAAIRKLTEQIKDVMRELVDAGIPDSHDAFNSTRDAERKLKAIGKAQLKLMRSRFTAVRNEMYKILAERDGEKCIYCGSTHKIEVDHIVPLSYGGSNEIENLQLACKRCNFEKRDSLLYYWLKVNNRQPGWDWLK